MQQEPEPLHQAAEVVSGGCEDGVDGVALVMGEEVPVHAVILLGVADHGLDGGAASELAFDGVCDAPFLGLGVDLQLMLRGRIVALIARVRQNTGQRRPGNGFDARKSVPARHPGPRRGSPGRTASRAGMSPAIRAILPPVIAMSRNAVRPGRDREASASLDQQVVAHAGHLLTFPIAACWPVRSPARHGAELGPDDFLVADPGRAPWRAFSNQVYESGKFGLRIRASQPPATL